MPVLTVEKPLRDKLGDDAVDSLVRLIEQSQENQKNGILEFVEEKFERRLSEEISNLRIILSEKISDGDKKLAEKISEVETRLSEKITQGDNALLVKISETKAELIKWMFIFWIGQVAFILGILFTFFKK
jgi:tRNA uridine 5-carbamoylmethylation protein Kti12